MNNKRLIKILFQILQKIFLIVPLLFSSCFSTGEQEVKSTRSVTETNDTGLSDSELPRIEFSDSSVVEGGNATITITAYENVPPANVTINYTLENITATAGTDFNSYSSSIVLPAGSLSKNFTVSTLSDGQKCSEDKTFRVKITSINNGKVGSNSNAIVTVTDDPNSLFQPILKVDSTNITEGSSINAYIEIPYACSGSSLSVGLRSFELDNARLRDIDFTSGTLTIPAGSTISNLIPITAIADSVQEKNERFILSLINDEVGTTIFTQENGIKIMTIIDNNSPAEKSIIHTDVVWNSSCALDSQGSFKCFGAVSEDLFVDSSNIIGDEPSEVPANLDPIQLPPGYNVIDVSLSSNRTCAVFDNWKTKCWGLNSGGIFGLEVAPTSVDDTYIIGDQANEISSTSYDALVGADYEPKSIKLGNSHICGLFVNSVQSWPGTIMCWGDGRFIGKGLNTGDFLGTQAGEISGNVPINIPVEFVKYAVGRDHNCGVDIDNDLYCWGSNLFGQMGHEIKTEDGFQNYYIGDNGQTDSFITTDINIGARTILDIAASSYSTCVVLSDNKVKCWGSNVSGELGLELDSSNGSSSYKLGDDIGEMGTSLDELDLGSFLAVKIYGGDYHFCAVSTTGSVKCWGKNAYGQLGIATTDLVVGDHIGDMGNSLPSVSLPSGVVISSMALGKNHTCALSDIGKVYCWGDNDNGQLGYGDYKIRGTNSTSMGNNLTELDFGSGRTVSKIFSGHLADRTCALLDNGDLKCWGDSGKSSFNAIGIGSKYNIGDETNEMGVNLQTINLGTDSDMVDFELAWDGRSCARFENDKMKCWGSNLYGSLGQGISNQNKIMGLMSGDLGDNLNYIDLGATVPISYKMGRGSVCVLGNDLKIYCWGKNDEGQLGIGSTEYIGDSASEMGNNLRPADLNLENGTWPVQLVGGERFFCVLLNTLQPLCWGKNSSGLGRASDNTDAVGDSPEEISPSLHVLPKPSGLNYIKLATDAESICALFDNKTVRCVGNNQYAQLGHALSLTYDDSSTLISSRSAILFDSAFYSKVEDLITGANNFCVVNNSNQSRCWGYHGELWGALGNGATGGVDSKYIGDTAIEMNTTSYYLKLGAGVYFTEIATGKEHTCAIVNTGGLRCIGSNKRGQLGRENTTQINSTTNLNAVSTNINFD